MRCVGYRRRAMGNGQKSSGVDSSSGRSPSPVARGPLAVVSEYSRHAQHPQS